jgi:chaperone modulatory protein CbpM
MAAATIVLRSADPIEVRVLAAESGVHPDLVRRFVALGLFDARRPPRDAAAQLARAARLRRDLGLNYAGAVLATELLARIDELERRLSRYEPR